MFNLIVASLSVAYILIVLLKTNVFVEYCCLFGLSDWFYIPDYFNYRKTPINRLLYFEWLLMTFENSFFIKLITCPICLSFYLSLLICLFIGVKFVFAVACLASLIYFLCDGLMRKH